MIQISHLEALRKSFVRHNATTCGIRLRQTTEDPTSGAAITYGDKTRSITGTGERDTTIPDIRRDDDGKLKLWLFIDRAIIELFVNDGQQYAINYMHRDPQDQGISLFAVGGKATVEMTAWQLGIGP